uniref:Uncharacterized protein n=1 Tax=Mucochytrium quahogii TaxID=96639 RepID=A0A7S2WER0_9STRA|mmetsp:Transcript_27893/g.44707  ORF Transcript_27893/g.44707 Transcript_27893/m.44707 type:complete len:739 (-) Transcript_27893:666-2882(-)|eukprot:CAMPEP_0203755114 /NCGR_PEP_ID=MMETSP0098-20131031/8617_1 /ASSEMBLY_ACC=CAM_ASM_000208 /TAXON_ID=96639 /ORGANISM=" , Strain NY0313808BC1" /LENGTH=738 /DNA_ID=CAMNT_0050646443 /DNA_START=450 /DNA_END=2666 /DNA_ORIENTATION=+
MDLLSLEEQCVLKNLFEECSNGRGYIGYARTLRVFEKYYCLPLSLGSQYAASGFEYFADTSGELNYQQWCHALEHAAALAFTTPNNSSTCALRCLVEIIQFENTICDDASEFVHVLNCVGALSSSFCHWDAYRLHKQRAHGGFRALLGALRLTGAVESFKHPQDLNPFTQLLLSVDSQRKSKFNMAMLETLDQLSAILIELYPELGLGCSFIEFVEKVVDDNLIPVLCATHLDIYPVNDQEAAWGDKENVQLNSRGTWTKERATIVRNRLPKHNRDGPCVLNSKTPEKNDPPLLLRIFQHGCSGKENAWVSARFYWFVSNYIEPKIPFGEIQKLLHGMEKLNLDEFLDTMEVLVTKHPVTLNIGTRKLEPFQCLDIDLLSYVFNNSVLEGTGSFDAFVKKAQSTVDIRIRELFEFYKFDGVESIDKTKWFAFVCSFFGVFDGTEQWDMVKLSSMSYLYHELHPFSGLTAAIDLLFMHLPTAVASSSEMILLAFVKSDALNKEQAKWLPPDCFRESAKVSGALLEQVERNFTVVESLQQLKESDLEVYLEYLEISPSCMQDKLLGPMLVESLLRVGCRRKTSPALMTLQLFSKPVYLSRSGVYDYLFQPNVVMAFERARADLEKVFKRYCDPSSKILSSKSFMRAMDTMNLGIGVPDTGLKVALVKLLRDGDVLERVYLNTVDETEQMSFVQFQEAVGRVSLALSSQSAKDNVVSLETVLGVIGYVASGGSSGTMVQMG